MVLFFISFFGSAKISGPKLGNLGHPSHEKTRELAGCLEKQVVRSGLEWLSEQLKNLLRLLIRQR